MKVISPSFEMRYIKNDNEIEETIKKVIRYTIRGRQRNFVCMAESIFAGVYFEDLKKFSNYFNENFSKNHLIVFGINTEDLSNNNFYNSL